LFAPGHLPAFLHLPLGEEDAKWVRLVTALVFRLHPLAVAAVRHAVSTLGVLEKLPDELRAGPCEVSSILTRVLPLGKLLVGNLVLGVMPGITGKQREIASHIVEGNLHSESLQLILAHASVTVTQISLFSSEGSSPRPCIYYTPGIGNLHTFVQFNFLVIIYN
jgi:hypothetical protein